jgi:ADP-dependent phosphofructokinase/glucokinase
MIELNSDDVDERRAIEKVSSVEIQANIEHAIREEMRRHRARAPKSASTLRSDLIAVCIEAHRLGMQAEALVIAIKDVWQRIPEARSYARPIGADSILSESVTTALDEFYRVALTPPLAD